MYLNIFFIFFYPLLTILIISKIGLYSCFNAVNMDSKSSKVNNNSIKSNNNQILKNDNNSKIDKFADIEKEFDYRTEPRDRVRNARYENGKIVHVSVTGGWMNTKDDRKKYKKRLGI